MNSHITYSGSRLYGCANNDSDVDIRGWYIPPYKDLLGLQHTSFDFDADAISADDVSIWNIKHYFDLLCKGSPIAIELLFCPQDKIIQTCQQAKLISAERSLFINSNLYKSFFGYAESCYKRWLAKRTPKDLYHAIRVVFELIQLMGTNRIDFHLIPHNQLKLIKSGQTENGDKIYSMLLANANSLRDLNLLPKPDLGKIHHLYCRVIADEMKEYASIFTRT